jgi:predicted Fe-Mo cluster-binding NifX family protein
MKIAIPTTEGRLCDPFTACRHFTLTELDESNQVCRTSTLLPAPDGDVRATVDWLVSQGVTLMVAGTMDPATERAFCAAGIRLLLGAPSFRVHAVVARYLLDQLEMARTAC